MAPVAFWVITTFVLGITVGSFLTAAIYRLNPANWPSPLQPLSLLEPQRSMCPNCKHPLGVVDLLPLFSFLLFGQKCRYCRKPISWRYFGVEILTGLTFVVCYLMFPFPHNIPTLMAMLVFVAVLIPICFIDLATFTIPISLTLLATVVPIARDAWGITHQEAGFELLGGWLPRSLMGWLVGTLLFGLIRIAGWLYKGVEALGLGDVYLARGMGALFMLVPVGQFNQTYWPFPLWIILSCLSGILVFPIFVAVRRPEQQKYLAKMRDRYGNLPADVESTDDTVGAANGEIAESEPEEPQEAWGIQFAYQWLAIIQVLIGYDAYEWIRFTFDRRYRADLAAEAVLLGEEPEWVPAPTAIPFGPFLVVGFLLTIFFGPAIILAYRAYAHL